MLTVCACRAVPRSAAAAGTERASGFGLGTAGGYQGSCRGAAPARLEPAFRGQGSSDPFRGVLLFCKGLSSLAHVWSSLPARLLRPWGSWALAELGLVCRSLPALGSPEPRGRCAPGGCSHLGTSGHRARKMQEWEEDAVMGGRCRNGMRLLSPLRIHSVSSPITSWAPSVASNDQKWELLLLAEESQGSHEGPSMSVPMCGVKDLAQRLLVTLPSAPSAHAAIRPEGKNNRLFVFSISMASVSRLSLDVAADTHEDLLDWVKKIREAAQTADARVSLERHLLVKPWILQGTRSRWRLVGRVVRWQPATTGRAVTKMIKPESSWTI